MMMHYNFALVQRSGPKDNRMIVDIIRDWDFRKLTRVAWKRDQLLKQGYGYDNFDIRVIDCEGGYWGTLIPETLKDAGY